MEKHENKKSLREAVSELVVTRYPIFDRNKEVFAYEILFKPRSRRKSDSDSEGDDLLRLKTIDGLVVNGLKRLANGKTVVVNFNAGMLMNDLPLAFPSDLLGVEIDEDVKSDSKVTHAIKKIKNAGYLLIVNDYLYNHGDLLLVKMADIIGVDFRSQGLMKRISIFESDSVKPRFLAKSVETPMDFSVASDLGYQYFQGDFFSTPDIVSVRNIPSYKFNLLRILKEINKANVQFDEIEQILKRDVSITYKLLRFVNSACFGIKTTVQSIRHALTLLGEVEVKKWLSFIVVTGIGTDQPLELIRDTVIRAKFCESLAPQVNLKDEAANFFLMGMFSKVDVFLGRPMEEVLSELPLDAKIKSALLGESNRFRQVLDLVTAYEKGEWHGFGALSEQLKLAETLVGSLYLEAVEWGEFF